MTRIDAESNNHCKLLMTSHGAVFNKYVEGIINIYAPRAQPVLQESSWFMLLRIEILWAPWLECWHSLPFNSVYATLIYFGCICYIQK
jgi:hypothetical protein